MKQRGKRWNRLCAAFLVMVMVVSAALPALASSVTTEKNGYYHANLKFTNWAQTENRNTGMNISDSVVLLYNKKTGYTLQFEINAYSAYEAIYMVKQDKNGEISGLLKNEGGKLGTDWTTSNGDTLSGYENLSDQGLTDESLNDCYQKLTPTTIDESLDTAVFNVANIDPNEKIGLIGYLYKDKTASWNGMTFHVDPNSVEYAQNEVFLTAGYNMGAKLHVSFSRSRGNEKDSYWRFTRTDNYTWENFYYNEKSNANMRESWVDSVSCTLDTDKAINVTVKMTDEFKELEPVVNQLESRDRNYSSDAKSAYIAGNYNRIWGEDNLYDEDTNSISFVAKSTELLFGKQMRFFIHNGDDEEQIWTTMHLVGSEHDNSIVNEATGIKYDSNTRYTPETAQLDVSVDTDETAIDSIKQVAGDGDYKVYTLKLTNEGTVFQPTRNGTVKIPLPDGWDEKYLHVQVTRGQSTVISWPMENYLRVVEENGKKYIAYYDVSAEKVLNGETSIAIAQFKQAQDVSNLSAGIYETEVNFLKAATDAQTSMSSLCLDNKAYLVVAEDGTKEVYLNFHGMVLDASNPEGKAYLGGIWNVSTDDVSYYDFETDEKGALLDNAEYDANTEFACVKSVKLSLSESTYDKDSNKYALKVLPTAMANGMPYEEVLTQAFDADLVFYSVSKISDDTAIPTYQKSVLRRSIDKAKGYTESAYSAETWSALQTALTDGEDYYKTLDGTDAGTDASISNEIKAKSDAIETALTNLAENDDLKNAREALQAQIDEAKQIEIGNKTVTAFNELTDAITTAENVCNSANIKVEDLTAAGEALQNAVKTFKASANVSKLDHENLADGEYKVYVKMVRPDGVDSMCNPSIDHWLSLTVKDGKYTAQLDFQGMTLSGQFGYLQSLKYYESGYTNNGTAINGTLKDVTVISTQKNTDGSDVVDKYNDDGNGKAKFLYPDIVSFPLVDGGSMTDVPLQVFVPVMEAISEGTGTQDTMMRIDWTSLKDANDTTQESVDFDANGIYTLTSALRDAGSEDDSACNVYLDKTRLIVKDNSVTAYVDFKSTDGSYLTGMQVFDEAGDAVEVTATTKKGNGELVRASFTLPQNYELTNVKFTDHNGNTADARLYLALRDAALQEADKANLKTYLAKAEEKLNDGNSYTETSRTALESAADAAKKVDEDPTAIQEEISAAGLTLRNALNALEEIPKADKAALKTTLDNAKAINNDDNTYTADSYQAFTDAIAAAEKVYNDANAEQGAVDAQVAALEAAYAGLVKRADTSALDSLIKKAEKLNPTEYTAASWSALEKAFKTADAVNNNANATQEEVEAQVKLLQAAIDALVPAAASSGDLADGVYEIDATIMHSNNSQKSMADAALVRPVYLIVKDGDIRAQMQFTYLDIDGTEGYMGQMNYLTYDGDTIPTKDEQDYAAIVEAYYTGYDNYNDPEFGTDKVMTTKTDPTTGKVDTRYPEVMSIPMAYNDAETWLHVYVPVMGTWQYARLQLDWNTVKQVRPSDVNADALKEQIAEAKKLEQGNASENTWTILQAAISSAQEIYDNLSATQAQIDAQTAYLQQAMAMVNAENKAVDKTALKAAINQAEKKLQQIGTYTAQSLAVLQQYKDDAEALYDNAKATQSDVDAMTASLTAAMENLTELTVDTSELESKIAEAEKLAKETDTYTEASINALKIAIRNAQNALDGETVTQATVDNQLTALQSAMDALKEKENVDKSALKAKISDAQGYVDNASAYTESSIAALKTAIANAQSVYNDEDATQSSVNAQVSALNAAISALVKTSDSIQDITNLADGVYSLTGTMVKVDRETLSMCNDSINHTIKLTVKDGKYFITMDFKGLTVGDKLGYLGQLFYYKTGYTVDKYGNPTGDTTAVTVESVQKYEDGTVVTDTYGTNYPDVVSFELIPEALEDGFVPLQVVVPIMEKVAAGAGTQPVYLKLDWTSLKSTTTDDPNFTDTTDTNDKTNTTDTNNTSTNPTSTLGTSTLPSGSTGTSSLTGSTGTTSLTGTGTNTGKSSGLTSASSVKTGDTQPLTGWLALLAISGIALAVLLVEKKLHKGEKRNHMKGKP
ncbi:MAG: NEAT domain-containing protein [Clostridia bacterium]|nr:NEAT domain-containing protein [Clostridia bacterium]